MRPLFRILTPVYVFAVAALLAASLQAQFAAGVLEGRVYNAATGSVLVNARVTLEGAGWDSMTDEAGSFRLTGVPAGEAPLSVSYLEMAPQKATVSGSF